MQIISFTVQGDHDQAYVIALRDGVPTCTCLAYRFGNGAPCKHMNYVANQMVVRGVQTV